MKYFQIHLCIRCITSLQYPTRTYPPDPTCTSPFRISTCTPAPREHPFGSPPSLRTPSRPPRCEVHLSLSPSPVHPSPTSGVLHGTRGNNNANGQASSAGGVARETCLAHTVQPHINRRDGLNRTARDRAWWPLGSWVHPWRAAWRCTSASRLVLPTHSITATAACPAVWASACQKPCRGLPWWKRNDGSATCLRASDVWPAARGRRG